MASSCHVGVSSGWQKTVEGVGEQLRIMPGKSIAFGQRCEFDSRTQAACASLQRAAIRDDANVREDDVELQFRYLFVEYLEMGMEMESLGFTCLWGKIEDADLMR